MINFRFTWYTIAVLVIVIVLCILMTIGHEWARKALAILSIVFIVITWIREFIEKKKNNA